MRKGKSSRRENKSSSNGMVLVMSNMMTKRSNAGKGPKRLKSIKPQSETGNGKNYHQNDFYF